MSVEQIIADRDRLAKELEVQKGVVEFVYIPVHHLREEADKYKEQRDKLAEALRNLLTRLDHHFCDIPPYDHDWKEQAEARSVLSFCGFRTKDVK